MAAVPLRGTLQPLQTIADESLAMSSGKATRNVAAFVTRMVAYRRGDDSATAGLPSDTIPPVAAFISSDHPSAVTVRMQCAFEGAYHENNSMVERTRRNRLRKMNELSEAIGNSSSQVSSDITVLTTVYKQILAYVTTYLSVDLGAAGLKAAANATNTRGAPASSVAAASAQEAAQREMQAAMESVFPRVGVRKFTALSTSDKTAELDEIAHLVLGIRLFNWAVGKGGSGTGIEDTPALALAEVDAAIADIDRAATSCGDLAQQYTDVLQTLRAGAMTIPSGIGITWPAELVNRRQLGVYLNTVLDELNTHSEALRTSQAAYKAELEGVVGLVGSRAAVAKELVYPKFHNIAAHWLKIAEIRDLVTSCIKTYDALAPFIPPTACSLPAEVSRAAHSCIAAGTVGPSIPPPPEAEIRAAMVAFQENPGAKPLRLSLDHSPEFLQLPLDFQGYCPVTLTASVGLDRPTSADDMGMGIIAPGDPSVGVIRWRNKHVVCSTADAAAAFCAAPEYYIRQLRHLALKNIELVHLLQLLGPDTFVEASLPAIVQYDGDISAAAAAISMSTPDKLPSPTSAGGTVRLSKNGRVLIDKEVSTPTHIVERFIDPHYEWNEWALRRKALATMNLLNCKTTSAQTDASHFRRDNDTQVYLSSESGTQTGISVSTNTTRVVKYIAGLRGAPEAVVEQTAERRGIPMAFSGTNGAAGASAGLLVASAKPLVSVGTSTATTPASDPSGKKLNMAVVTLSMDL